jgi:hypothetical protein
MTAIAQARGRSAADRMLRTAARGAILIGVAVIIGIVLLQVVDEGGTGPSASSNNNGNGSSVTTTTEGGARVPQEVVVAVFNASGLSGAAQTQANELRGLGYQTLPAANAASQQTGSTVACQSGYEQEADGLIAVVDGATIAAFPTPIPAGAEGAHCIVTVGKAA